MGGLAELIRFCIAIMPPKVVLVSAQAATLDGRARRRGAGPFRIEHRPRRRRRRASPGVAQLLAAADPAGCTVVNDPELY